jgi:mannose-6-phosphate isomerase-like protein (cupin superfamily)
VRANTDQDALDWINEMKSRIVRVRMEPDATRTNAMTPISASGHAAAQQVAPSQQFTSMPMPAGTTIISTIPLSRVATSGEDEARVMPEATPLIAVDQPQQPPQVQQGPMEREPSSRSMMSQQEAGETGGAAHSNAMHPFPIPQDMQESQSAEITYDSPITQKAERVDVIRRKEDLHLARLPGSEETTGEAPLAGAAFTCPNYTTGMLRLAPGCVKEPETTNTSSQVFFVSSCQPKALEVDIGTHRYFLSQGDHFVVPISLPFRLQNHSSFATAELTFCVINENNLMKTMPTSPVTVPGDSMSMSQSQYSSSSHSGSQNPQMPESQLPPQHAANQQQLIPEVVPSLMP